MARAKSTQELDPPSTVVAAAPGPVPAAPAAADDKGQLARLEAKLDQQAADIKQLCKDVGELRDWVKRMVRVVKAQ